MPGLRKLTLDDLWTFKMMGNIALSWRRGPQTDQHAQWRQRSSMVT